MDDRESKQLFEAVEVAIRVQQRVAFAQAKGGDQAVDSAPHGAAARPQVAVMLRRQDRQFEAAARIDLELPQRREDAGGVPLRPQALQDLADRQVDQAETVCGVTIPFR
jgi:hypothetical protein